MNLGWDLVRIGPPRVVPPSDRQKYQCRLARPGGPGGRQRPLGTWRDAVSELDQRADHADRPATPRWTHLALRVADMDATIAWYLKYTPLELLERREDEDGYGAWLGHSDNSEHPFVLVLAQFFPDKDPFAPSPIAKLAPFNHFGIELPNKADVDEIAARGEADGCLGSRPSRCPRRSATSAC